MSKKFLWLFLALLAVPMTGAAQNPPSAPSYRPGLGDLMTSTIQPRHIKLAIAGRAQNWTYAAYEQHELEEAFERAAQTWPKWRNFPIAGMISTITRDPMEALEKAIKAQDEAAFTAAYAKLTGACDSCHQAAERGMIVIRVPDSSSFPDQEFNPPAK